MSARDIHGDLDQSQRTQSLDAFKEGDVNFLVATDVAARGIDIAMLPCVINYDVPTHAEDYVHRIGRTGRAGQKGRAFTLAFGDEGKFVDAIARLTGKKIPMLDMASADAPETGGEETAKSSARGTRRRSASGDAAKGKSSDRRRSGKKREAEEPESVSADAAACDEASPPATESPRKSSAKRSGPRTGAAAARQVQSRARSAPRA